MQPIKVVTDKRHYPIVIEDNLLDAIQVCTCLKKIRQAMIITNETVAPIYLDIIRTKLIDINIQNDLIILPDGENFKNWNSVEAILHTLIEKQHGRNTILIALGGGVIGDLTGFTAACYQRGINYLQMPTTLLAQVDASIGGKTAINHPLAKNMIGAFHHPIAVIIGIDTLYSLPSRQFISGLAEVIKISMVLDASFFFWLEKNIDGLLKRQKHILSEAIHKCCTLKACIVSLDEQEEKGQRTLLNFGHTFAHAIEAYSSYSGDWLHGEAVSIGMIMAATTAEVLGLLSSNNVIRLKNLLRRAQLPIAKPPNISWEHYYPYLLRDKKYTNNELYLILPTEIGRAAVVKQSRLDVLKKVVTTYC